MAVARTAPASVSGVDVLVVDSSLPAAKLIEREWVSLQGFPCQNAGAPDSVSTPRQDPKEC
jgi:hypothetical protein